MTGDLKVLQREWYDLLRETGFKDLEMYLNEKGEYEEGIYVNDSNLPNHISPNHLAEKQTYFQRASQFLHDHDFISPLDQEVWKLHSQGVTMRAIAKRCKMKLCQIFLIIDPLKKQMLHG